MDDEGEDPAQTLANPGHPIWKLMAGLLALLTLLWTQTEII